MDDDDEQNTISSTISSNNSDGFQFGLAYDPLDSAYYIGDFLYVCQLIFVIVGIPLNLLLVGIIVFLKRLHLQRNFIWIGVGISNIAVLATHLMEYLSVRWKTSFSSKNLCAVLLIVSIASQTWNFAIATLERHILLTYPEWHKRNITIRFVKVVECGSFLFLLFLMLLLTLLQFSVEEFHVFNSENFTLLGTLFLGGFPIFLMGQVTFMRGRILQKYPPVEVIGLANLQFPSNNEERSNFFVLVGNYRVSQLEVKAVESIFFMGLVYLIFVERNFDRSTFTRCSVYKNALLVFCIFFLEECFFFSYPKGSFRPLQRLCKKVAQVSAETQPLLRSIKKGLY